MKIYSLLILLILSQSLSAQLEVPRFAANDSIIYHTAYSLSYNPIYKQVNWIAYLLTREETSNTIPRSNNFKEDPLVPGTDFSKDYYKSGYDRGHLAPAADMGFSKITMLESFYYTNISPQTPSFNRGIWKKLKFRSKNSEKIT